MAGDILNIDLASQSFMRDPFPTLTRLREAGPVVRVKLPFLGKTWIATTYEAVNEVLKDDSDVREEPEERGEAAASPGCAGGCRPRSASWPRTCSATTTPTTAACASWSIRRSTARASRACAAHRRHSATTSWIGWRATGPVDLMEELARPLPLAVICELLGLPEEDRPRFRRWVQALMSVTSLWGIFRFLPGLFRLVGYFKRHFEQCRRQPRPGLMTALVQAEQDGDRLSENELLAMAFLLLVAGHETTVHLIGGGVLALLEAPEQKARLLADWSLVPSAVEELLRFVCPVQIAKPRYVSRDLEFHGRPLRRGEILIPMLASANADPGRFDDPERMDITRSPNPHVAFGTGMHFCLGAQLARVETQVVIEKLFTRFPNLSLAVPGSALSTPGGSAFAR